MKKSNINPIYLAEMPYYPNLAFNPEESPSVVDVTSKIEKQPIIKPSIKKITTNNTNNATSDDTSKGININPAQIYAGTVATGVASKITKDIALSYKIMKKYPEPMLLKARLMKINNKNCQILAAKLKPDTTRAEYRNLIRKYICKGNIWRYILHGVLGPVSTLYNTLHTVDNTFNTADDAIGNNV